MFVEKLAPQLQSDLAHKNRSSNEDLGVADGLALVHQMVALEARWIASRSASGGKGEWKGLVVTPQEVEAIINPDGFNHDALTHLEVEQASILQQLEQVHRSAGGRLARLIQLANLNVFEFSCVLLCLAQELDPGFDKLYGYIQDDITKKRPTVGLAMRMFARRGEKTAARAAFRQSAPLIALELIKLTSDPYMPEGTLVSHQMQLSPRIVRFLTGIDTAEELIFPYVLYIPRQPVNLDPLPTEFQEQVARFAGLINSPFSRIIQVENQPGVVNQTVARFLADRVGTDLLQADFAAVVQQAGITRSYRLLQRESHLLGCGLYLTNLQSLTHEQRKELIGEIDRWQIAPMLILGGESGFQWSGVVIKIPELNYQARRELWQSLLAQYPNDVTSVELDLLADKFKLNAEGIGEAIRSGLGSAFARDPQSPSITKEDLYVAARSRSTPILSSLAKKITPHYAWKDIILPEDTLQQMREMCAYVEKKHVVYETWGFGKKFVLGKGLMALFAGDSGTGKTMAADIIAGVLGLDLYKIDLSGVVSKYVGETEKNLSRIFDEARNSNAILFFDEADALFGKRSEVKDSHDRYANIEISYLLQRMEEFDGVVILSTNMKNNLDEAFLRRMHFVVDFPMPEEQDRRKIWSANLPSALPLAEDVDLDELARRFKISGGNIRNIILSAAFLAATENTKVGMQHFLWASRREFQKMGRMIDPSDFSAPQARGEHA